MLRSFSPGRVIQTRNGTYAVALIPLPESDIPGFDATHIQAVRADGPPHVVRLTLFERHPTAGPEGHPRAA